MADTRKAAETNLRNAFETTLSGTLGATDTTLNLTSTTGLTSPIYLVIDPDSSTSREYIFIDGTINASSAAMSTVDNRYLTGSAAASGLSHVSGTKVRVSPMAQMFEDIWDAVGKVIDGTWSSGTAGEVVFNVSAADVDHTADEIFIRDANDSNKVKRESISDFLSAIDGAGLGVASSQLKVDINGSSSGTVAGGDEILFADINDSNNIKKTTAQDIANLASAGVSLGLVLALS
tara:strand:+ start:289 stop:990 length:702 start_codon:yes stop_codon:yes gene_type:complete